MKNKTYAEWQPLSKFLQEYKELNANSKYRPVAVGRYGIRTRESIYSKELAKDYSKNKLIYKGTLTVGMGSVQMDIGILSEDEIYSVSPAYHTYKISGIDNDYLRYCLQCRNKDMFARFMKRGSRQGKSIDLSRWIEYEIPVCPDYKQKEIVSLLDRVQSVIILREQELEKLDDLIKARFVEMFGSISNSTFEKKILPEITINDKNAIKRGPFGGALKKEDFVDNGYLVYEQRHAIHDDFEYAKYYITKEKYDSMIGFRVVPGDLIISCSGVTLGRIAEIPDGAKDGIINQALLKLSLDQNVMMNTFFIQQFRGEEIQDVLFGFSRGSGIPNMPSMSEVKTVQFICPPIELQKNYCDFVEQVDKSKIAIQKALDEARLLMDSLMNIFFRVERKR